MKIEWQKLVLTVVTAALLATAVFIISIQFTPVQEVRGKSPARPLSDVLSAEQQLAQEIALADTAVQAYTLGNRSEVFGVRPITTHTTAKSSICAQIECRQVEIYSFDTNATTTVIVSLSSNEVLDVLHQPGLQPGINKRLADLAVNIAMNDPGVIDALGFKPTQVDMAPVAARMSDTSCDGGHLCAGPTFNVGNRVLWAVVDLTEEKIAGLDWTEVSPDGPSEMYRPLGGFCPSPGSVNRDGWAMEYETTQTDGLRIANVTYQGREVLRSAKLVEWHVDYNGVYHFPGFFDVTGCSDIHNAGFPIDPYGETQIVDLVENAAVVGFEVVQDFRMPNWGAACNYRYEQRMQFWLDGRFRIVSGAFGRGCGDSSSAFDLQPFYRPVVRIDVAVDGDDNDSLFLWDGLQWQPQTEETYRTPYEEAGHGPHNYNADGAIGAIVDENSGGYFVLPSQGQFGGAERGDEPFVYVTLHNPAEGDTDLPIINPEDSYKYNDDHKQGPDLFVNGESVAETNIVLWYVAQHGTDRIDGNDPQYCWTQSAVAPVDTSPCYGGPMFVPFGFDEVDEITASFVVNGNEFGVADTAVFTSTSTIPNNAPALYTWNFGDGITATTGITATHHYYLNGVFTPTLTVASFGLDEKTAVGQPITATAKNVFLPMIVKP